MSSPFTFSHLRITLSPPPPTARHYNSDLSIWLSVDPMSDKYPSTSPYVYCGNNPVVLKDPNGEDYEVVVDKENKSITITATYYAENQSDYEQLQQGLAAWNEQSGKYTYTTKDNEVYDIYFQLDSDCDEDKFNAAFKDANENRGATYNAFVISDMYEYYQEGDRGTTRNGHVCYVKSTSSLRTTIHEIGHTLGIGDFNGDNVMVQGIESSYISNGNIREILVNAGLSCTGTVTSGNPKTSSDAMATTSGIKNGEEMQGKLQYKK